MDLIYVINYLAGLSLAYAFDDLSYNKSATQSHTFKGTIYEAGRAVDRNTTTCMRTLEIGTTSYYKTVWWKVDLGGVYSIYNINILFMNYDGNNSLHENRQRGRFAGFSLYISNSSDIQSSTLCYKNGPQLPTLNFTTTCTEHGRYVIFYNERLNGAKYPARYETANVYTELCEVIVQGCNRSGVFGINCDKPCPSHCKDNTCHIENGSCCKTGWNGTSCDTDSMQEVGTNDEASSTLWIVAFCISLVINIIFISAILISRRKQKSTKDLVTLSGLTPNTEQTVAIEPNHYQELGVSLHENTYPNLSTEQTVAIEPIHYLELGVSLNENTYLSHL